MQTMQYAATPAKPKNDPDTPSFNDLLPATFRLKEDHLVEPEARLEELLQRELSVERLDRIHDWLWVSGRPVPPRPLHHQVLLRRNISITEQPDLHLVWSKDRIFIKPLPAFLLHPDFFQKHACTSDDRKSSTPHDTTYSSSSSSSSSSTLLPPAPSNLAKAARGFLFSYAALIAYPSDFAIATEKGLLPQDMTWPQWKQTAHTIVSTHTYDTISPRYRYGELRLSRLNKIYRFKLGAVARGYSRIDFYSRYGGFFAAHSEKIIAVSAYVVIALAAMQVGLATERLRGDAAFHGASFGLAVFTLVAPFGGVGIVGVMFLWLVLSNGVFAGREGERRRRAMDRWDGERRGFS